MADIRIDRYEVDVATNGQTLSITDVGSVSNAFINYTANSIKGSGGRIGSTSNELPTHLGVGIQITNTNEVTFYRESAIGSVKVMFEIWVYTAAAGGAYEFINRQSGSVVVANGTTGNTESLSGISNRNKCIPMYNGFTTTEAANADYEGVTLSCHINASTQVSFDRGNLGKGTSVTAYYDVVEFTGSAWSVGYGFDNNHDAMGTAGLDITLNTDSTGLGGNIFDVGDWSNAVILETSMGADSVSETGLADCQLLSEPSQATTQVKIAYGDNNARNDDRAYVHVLKCDDFVISRYSNNNFAEGNNTYTNATIAGVNAETPLNELSLKWTVSTTGVGTAWARGCLVAQITSATTVQTWVHRSGNNIKVRASVVDISLLVDVISSTDIKNIRQDGIVPTAIYVDGVLSNKSYYDGMVVWNKQSTSPGAVEIRLSSGVAPCFSYDPNTSPIYYTDTDDFENATQLYTDPAKTQLVAGSFPYSNGIISRNWDEATGFEAGSTNC